MRLTQNAGNISCIDFILSNKARGKKASLLAEYSLSRPADIVISRSASKMLEWTPSIEQIKNFSEAKMNEHCLETIVYSVSGEGIIESLTFAFPSFECPPLFTYPHEPTRPCTLPEN